jgi:tRNA-Thr(GGU) m(6)t(6)A37 methyltransferase TsaA
MAFLWSKIGDNVTIQRKNRRNMSQFTVEPIGIIDSPYQEKFAVPRQPSLVPSAKAKLHLLGEANTPFAVEGLTQFSHIWLLFMFDKNIDKGWKPRVRPPRLGGNQKIGVFASRATFRPNHIGMSLVELTGVSESNQQVSLELSGVDLVNGTPVIDIKPYLPYADSVDNAKGGYAESEPDVLDVEFSSEASKALDQQPDGEHHRQVIREVLAQDPRPAYKNKVDDNNDYGVHLFHLNVQFKVHEQQVIVTSITPLASKD